MIILEVRDFNNNDAKNILIFAHYYRNKFFCPNASLCNIDYRSFSFRSVSHKFYHIHQTGIVLPSVLFNQPSQHYKFCVRTKNRRRNQWNLERKKSIVFVFLNTIVVHIMNNIHQSKGRISKP